MALPDKILKEVYSKAWKGLVPNLRPREEDEIVLENDTLAGNQYLIDQWLGEVKNKIGNDYRVEVYSHNGKCPHLHIKKIQGLTEISDLKERSAYRRAFMTEFGGKDVDLSLGDVKKMIPTEGQIHWKKRFGDPEAQHYTEKKLVEVWNEQAVNKIGKVKPQKTKKSDYNKDLELEARRYLDIQSGNKIHCPSKEHEDKEPSCVLYFNNNSWFCFGCRKSGKITDLFPKNIGITKQKEARREITENIVSVIHAEHRIFTIANDKNPEMWYYKDGIYIPEAASMIKEMTREILNESFTLGLANEVIAKIQSDTFINEKDFFSESHPNLIPLENGIYDLNNDELIDFKPDYVFFQKLPINYDSNATCFNIQNFFHDVLESEDDVRVMQEFFGYLLYKDHFIEKAVMFNGSGRNGKSKTLDLMRLFLGENNVTSVPIQKLETDQYAPALLFGKMANLAGDLNSTALKETGTFKDATGRGFLHSNRKHKTHLTFVSYAKMAFSCNELPRTYDLSPAFWNRWVFFNFPFKFCSKKELALLSQEQKDSGKFKLMNTGIIEQIATRDEINGLFNWAVDGLKRLRKNGDFSYSKTVDDIKKTWVRRSNSFAAFCEDNLVESYTGKIAVIDLMKAYHKYCKDHKVKKVGSREIESNMLELFGAEKTRKSRRINDYSDHSDRFVCYEGVEFALGLLDSDDWSTLLIDKVK